MVLQGAREDVVAQVEDKEADDEHGAHAGPHGLPVPVQSAASHGLKVTFKSIWKMGREGLITHTVELGVRLHIPFWLARACCGTADP